MSLCQHKPHAAHREPKKHQHNCTKKRKTTFSLSHMHMHTHTECSSTHTSLCMQHLHSTATSAACQKQMSFLSKAVNSARSHLLLCKLLLFALFASLDNYSVFGDQRANRRVFCLSSSASQASAVDRRRPEASLLPPTFLSSLSHLDLILLIRHCARTL